MRNLPKGTDKEPIRRFQPVGRYPHLLLSIVSLLAIDSTY